MPMTDLHIDHLLLRYEGTRASGERLRAIAGQAMELAAARLDAPEPGARVSGGAVMVDLETMTDDAIVRLLADALLMKLEMGG